jgi:hypothetical protein
METVITRILEIEKQSAMDIERTEEGCRKNIEAHRQAREEEKKRAHDLIIAKENTRLTAALRTLNKQTEGASLAAGKNHESLFRDPATVDAVKEIIVAILLAG